MLTIQELIFIQKYVETLDEKQAYKEANMSPRSNLLERPDIQREITEQVSQKLDKLSITSDYIISNIKQVLEDSLRPIPKSKMNKDGEQFFYQDENHNMIFEKDNNTALKALELLGRYKSLFTDKIDTTQKTTVRIEDLLDDVTDTDGKEF